eukprot:TRINITY_DN2506_c0_g1_i8.p1 TRINITY_DN2506_c0_g1~~TRINITY_DN2506_c0_g1_i8.p1  ORF type:complete len:560 (-),score=35.51 TRINITY_DN2506_c0_g1_i8:406-2085(-)
MQARLHTLLTWLQEGTEGTRSQVRLALASHGSCDINTLSIKLSEFQSLAVHVDLWSGKFVLQSSNMSLQALKKLQDTMNSPEVRHPEFFKTLGQQSLSIEMYRAAKLLGLSCYLKGTPSQGVPSLDICVPAMPPQLLDNTVYIRFPFCSKTFVMVSFMESAEPTFSMITASGRSEALKLPSFQVSANGDDPPKPASSGRKRKKTQVAPETSAASIKTKPAEGGELIRSKYCQLLAATIDSAQSSAQSTELVQMISAAGVPLKEREDVAGLLEFSPEAGPLEICSASAQPIKTGGFSVQLVQKRPVFCTQAGSVKTQLGKGTFSYSEKCLEFRYEQGTTWDCFKTDFEAVRVMASICAEVEELAGSNSLPLAVKELSLVRAWVVYDPAGENPQNLRFQCLNTGRGPAIHLGRLPACPQVDMHLSLILSSLNRVSPVLVALDQLWFPFQKMQEFVAAHSAESRIVVHSHHCARIVFLPSLFALEVDFLPRQQVRMGAVFLSAQNSRKSVSNFNSVVSESVLPAVTDASSREAFNARKEVLIPHVNLMECLEILHDNIDNFN